MTDTDNYQNDSLGRALALIAIILSVVSLVWSYQGAKRSRDALNRVEQIQTTTNTDGSQAPGLMQGTQQPPQEPPTQ